MSKLKTILKGWAFLALGVGLLVVCLNQDHQTQMFLGIYALILYIAYLAENRLSLLKKEKFYSCTFEKEVIAADSDEVVAFFEVDYTQSRIQSSISALVIGDFLSAATIRRAS